MFSSDRESEQNALLNQWRIDDSGAQNSKSAPKGLGKHYLFHYNLIAFCDSAKHQNPLVQQRFEAGRQVV